MNISLKDSMVEKLTIAFDPTQLEVVDQSSLHKGHGEAGDARETHFLIVISSKLFKGLSKLEAHRFVYEVLKEEMPKLHALSVKISQA